MISGLQVQLSETRRELQELKGSLRVSHKEKEQLLAEKQVKTSIFSDEFLSVSGIVLHLASSLIKC